MAGPRLDEACGEAMAEPQADDVARQGRAVARDDDAARAASLNHDGAPSGGPSDRECLALGSAESFAQTLLLQDQTVTARSILEVFELVPAQELPRGSALEGAKAFSIGAYSHGGIVGVRESTKLFPHVARLFCKAISVVSPSHLFSTITLHRQVHVSCHQDSQNYGVPNLVVPLTFFEGGQIFVHDAQGPDWQCGAPGHLLDVQLRPWVFNAKRYKHEVLPHSGVRATMVAYLVSRLHLLCDRDRCLLESLGFKVPTSEAGDLPVATSEGLCDLRRHDPDLQDPNPSPLSPRRPDPKALPMIHAPLPDAGPLIIELFAGSATLSALASTRGYSVLPVDWGRNKHRVRAKVHSLDLSQASSWRILEWVLDNREAAAVYASPPGAIGTEALQRLCSFLSRCQDRQIHWVLEAPSSSNIWASQLLEPMCASAHGAHCDLCALDFLTAIQLTFLSSSSQITRMQMRCRGCSHCSAPSSPEEMVYPRILCSVLCDVFDAISYDCGLTDNQVVGNFSCPTQPTLGMLVKPACAQWSCLPYGAVLFREV